jgi:hypothetical protein
MGSVKRRCVGLRKVSDRSRPAEVFLLLDLKKTLRTNSPVSEKYWNSALPFLGNPLIETSCSKRNNLKHGRILP